MGNKQTSPQEKENEENGIDFDDSGRRVRFQVYQERDSGLFRSFRTRPFKKTNPEKRRSITYIGTASKTAWPHPQSDSLFLPEYEYKSAVKFNDFQVNTQSLKLSIVCLFNNNLFTPSKRERFVINIAHIA